MLISFYSFNYFCHLFEFLDIPCYKETYGVTIKQMMSAAFSLNLLWIGCLMITQSYISIG